VEAADALVADRLDQFEVVFLTIGYGAV